MAHNLPQGFNLIHEPTVYGFFPEYAHVGSSFIITGKHMQDVQEVYFVDEFGGKHAPTEWDHIDSADTATNPGLSLVTCPWEPTSNPNDPCLTDGTDMPHSWSYVISGKVPTTSVENLVKFPIYSLEVKNTLGSSSMAAFEIVKTQYPVWDDLDVHGTMRMRSVSNAPSNNYFLTHGAADEVQLTHKSDFLTGVNEALIAELALSVQMNWTEFDTEYATSSYIATNGTADNTQGMQLAVIDIEPLLNTTSLLIDVDLSVSATELTDIACAMFKQGETTPRKVWSISNNWPDQMHTLRFRHIAPSSSSPLFQSWEFRVGVAYPSLYNYNGQVVYINRTQNYPNVYGDTATSVIWMREIKRNINN